MRHVFLAGVVFLGLCSHVASPIYAEEKQVTAASVAQKHAPAVYSYVIDRGKDKLGKDITTKGTAFLISNDPPLLATVAHTMRHVTDVAKLTVRDNITGAVRPAKTVILHPQFKVMESKKDPFSPDVALIVLTEPVPESVQRVPLGQGDTSQLQGQAIVSLGFSRYAALEEDKGETAEAVMRQGIIQRTVDFDAISTVSPRSERPLLEISTPCIEGESGAPIILLSTGQLIGIQIGYRKYNYAGTEIPAWIIPKTMHVKILQLMLAEERLMGGAAVT